MKKIVYVTGCLGFIGIHLTRQCLSQGWYVIGVDKGTYASNYNFLKEFNPGLTINNGDVEWTFEGIKFNANYTNYTLIFKAGNETLLVNYNDNTGYYLTGGIEDNLDNESISLLKDMFKYMYLYFHSY
jgi:dTDP-D-glucose 4,6-dehydratase